MKAEHVSDSRDYVGSVAYENGSLKRILFEGGYIEGGTYYYYLTDHLGNTRVVASGTGTVLQKNEYYPFGMPMATTANSQQEVQPYKLGGKEFDRKDGLNLYDFEARMMDPALGRFTSVDPLAEKYYSMSPYAYCNNNPLKFIDPDGRDPRKFRDWIKFGKNLVKAVHATISVGAQLSLELETATAPVGFEANLISIDLVGIKDGVPFHPGSNFEQSEIKRGVEIGVGVVGVGVQKTIKEESGGKVLEEKQTIGTVIAELENIETTPINDNYEKIGPTSKGKNVRVPDIGFKTKAILGIEVKLDVNKVWESLDELFNN